MRLAGQVKRADSIMLPPPLMFSYIFNFVFIWRPGEVRSHLALGCNFFKSDLKITAG